jgi:hypothetical protein
MNEYSVLTEARERLKRDGWRQQPSDLDAPSTCLGLAVTEAALRDKDHYKNEEYELFNNVIKRLITLSGNDNGVYSIINIYHWNDAPGRTFDDVLNLIDAAITDFVNEGVD